MLNEYLLLNLHNAHWNHVTQRQDMQTTHTDLPKCSFRLRCFLFMKHNLSDLAPLFRGKKRASINESSTDSLFSYQIQTWQSWQQGKTLQSTSSWKHCVAYKKKNQNRNEKFTLESQLDKKGLSKEKWKMCHFFKDMTHKGNMPELRITHKSKQKT